MGSLDSQDPEIAQAIENEKSRQINQINLIASENYASKAVLEAQGSVMTNKYAEGYPGRRYYGGCEFVDVAESIAIQRAKDIFGADIAKYIYTIIYKLNEMDDKIFVNQAGDIMNLVSMFMNSYYGGYKIQWGPVNNNIIIINKAFNLFLKNKGYQMRINK